MNVLHSNNSVELTEIINQLGKAFEFIPDLVWLKDTNGIYLYCNDQFLHYYGADKDFVIGLNDFDLFDSNVAKNFHDKDLRIIGSKAESTCEEWLNSQDRNNPKLFEIISKPISNDQKLICILYIAKDITEYNKREEDIKTAEIRLSTALKATRVGVWDWDLKREIWFATPSYFLMLGYTPPPDGIADIDKELEKIHPDDREIALNKINSILNGEAIEYAYESRVRHANGEYIWVSVRCSVIEFGKDKKPSRMLGVKYSVDELKRAQKRSEWLAFHDSLTGLPNRSMLDNAFDTLVNIANESNRCLALIFIDLDRFKNVNDTLGHYVGDNLLVEVANRLKNFISDSIKIGRQGGDEFIALIESEDRGALLAKVIEMHQALSGYYVINGHQMRVTPSLGISLYPDDGKDLESLYKSADIAMYNAKQSGRNRYVFFSDRMQQHTVRMLQLENAMSSALNNQEFFLRYQPQVCLETNSIIGVEVVIRWTNKEFGVIAPGEFIPLAEENGLILEIGEWVLNKSALQMKKWIDKGLDLQTMAVNLSAIQFRQINLVESISNLLESINLPSKYLELELTEGITMDDPETAIEIMNQLNELGLTTSIDDFGTGYSSLNYLKRFPVNKLKIDQSFVKTMTTDKSDKSIVEAIIALAKSLNLSIIAEGVETKEQLELLKKLGCAQVQGYYYSKPISAEEFEELMKTPVFTTAT